MLELENEPVLHYTCTDTGGYTRKRRGSGFVYLKDRGEVITDEQVLARIKKLVIPPAWKNVWISSDSCGHLQATGVDDRGRKQYIYHPQWNELREKKKISHIIAFGKILPRLRTAIKQDLRKKTWNKEKVSALALNIMENTLIRAGNDRYRKQNNSYGLTTLRARHVEINGQVVFFKFIGKKGKMHRIKLSNRSVAKRLKQVMEIPGQEVFQYLDEQNMPCCLDSGDLNEYIHRKAQCKFTSKDFRTWHANFIAFQFFIEEINDPTCQAGEKQGLNACLDRVAKKLGNTRAVCRASYVCNDILAVYNAGRLPYYLKKLNITANKSLDEVQAEKRFLKFLNMIQNHHHG